MPGIAGLVRWRALAALCAGSRWFVRVGYQGVAAEAPGCAVAAAMLAVILLCWWLVKRGVSQVYLLYGAAALTMIYSTRDLWLCWK